MLVGVNEGSSLSGVCVGGGCVGDEEGGDEEELREDTLRLELELREEEDCVGGIVEEEEGECELDELELDVEG